MSQAESTLKLNLQGIIKIEVELETVTGLLIASGRGTARIGGADTEHVSVERTYICPPESSNESSSATQAATSSGGQTVQGQTNSTQQTGGANATQSKREEIRVRVPYIPGSSLKGRIRSLLEVALGLPLYSSDGKIWAHTPAPKANKALRASEQREAEDENKLSFNEVINIIKGTDLDRLFGFPALHLDDVAKNAPGKLNDLLAVLTPTPLLIDDFFPDKEYVCKIYNENGIVTFDDFLEEKNENRIDRITSAADPRTVLRVKPGVKFIGNISILVYDKNADKLKDFLTLLAKGMKLLEATYLGASGSRGYGRVKFAEIKATYYNPTTMKETQAVTFNSVDDMANRVDEIISLVGVSK